MKSAPSLRFLVVAVLVSLIISGSPAQVSAQNAPGRDYRTLDEHALAAPGSVQTSFKSLASWLTAPCRSDEEKARVIFRWITQNIEYDVDALFAGSPMSGNAEDALRTRRAVCEGYAGLFMELAGASGIKAVKITGFAKGYGYSPGQQLGKIPNHSWNAVSIDGRWRLIDCTWGAGYIGNDRKFHRAFDPHFFFTPPREFIYDHLPDKEGWQLLDHPMSRGDYEREVYVKPGFFTLGLALGENSAGTLHADGEVVLRLGTTHPIAGVAALFKGERNTDDRYAFVQDELRALVVRVSPPDTGEYALRLFAKAAGDTGMYAWIMEYRIVSSRRLREFPAYPRKFSAFDTGNVRLIAPITGLLKGGSMQQFRLKIPWAEKAAVIVNEYWTYLERDGEDLAGDVTVQPGTVSVCAKYPGREEWDTLLEYRGK
jgi:hypothetical protein